MALYTRGVPVSVITDGLETALTAEMVAADVLRQVGGATAVRGPQGERGPQGPSGVGVPDGGRTGQLLAKTANSDYATTWVAAPVPAAAVGFVSHGTSETEQRPIGYGIVIWVGSGRPQLAQAGDLWIGG
ncbi:hypothetical protein Q5424_09350 [Conexibacter sp. JD483]|uniref:hypothetical protein n=1 Tax=unclassified Conexibacter TaxID=2627773 RepID=UPI002717AD91|nr:MULTISPECIES: hypothetical protein [unclassified Conexibacter]MDO8187218.1 hypothetical protein [Conexibacter sp. CPCC 205706]MDO8199315.1 hypothetical protein [Conexibacter sp. CPCC 205762]MDR9369284.1 hypothetical protein [Conexibacter sp. JD483]